MSPLAKILICACAVVALAVDVTAIECYNCIALGNDSPCGDKDFTSTNKQSTVDAGGLGDDCAYCLKSKAEKDGIVGIVRTCVADLGIYADDSCQEVNQDGINTEVCFCSGNLCNGVGRLSGSILVVMAVAMFKYLW